jgi:hypothetical protein
MLGGEPVPVQRIVRRGLMASHEVGRDAGFVVIAPRVPGLLEQCTGRAGIAVDGHAGGTEPGHDTVPVDHRTFIRGVE